MTPQEPGRSEPDVEADPHVASSRTDGENANSDDGDSYVGRTAPDDDFDAGESGAEARGRHRKPD
jgi:hypothetical protein